MNSMLISDLLRTSAEGLKRNRMRSFLTTIGIIIGVGSVVLMVSIGASFQAYIFGQLEGISSGTVDIYPKGMEKFGGSTDTITFEDGLAMTKLTTVQNVAQNIFITESVQYGREKEAPFILGTEPGFYKNYGVTASQGRLITDEDNKSARYVAVIGPDTAEDLFVGQQPLGKRITIGGKKFTVIGITKKMGSLTGQDIDKMVTVPFTVAKSITGKDYLDYITLEAKGNTELALLDIRSLLRDRHGIVNPDNDPDKDDFLARSAEQATQILGTVTTSLTLFLALIAGISLIVGGVGIMNIMLVSVSERTKEIGLRKAVGATQRNILLQFLIEAVALTLLGGIVGICGGIFIAWLAALVANNFLGDFPFAISWGGVVLSTCMAIGVGLVFGIFPARKAALMSPMEAMRIE